MFIHASGVMVATPEGKLARYLYGVEYQPKDLKLGLVEASHNRIGSPRRPDPALLLSLRPATGKYSLLVLNTLKLRGHSDRDRQLCCALPAMAARSPLRRSASRRRTKGSD